MYAVIAVVTILVAGAGLVFCYTYLPLRKYLYINLNPTWKRRAAPYEFPPELEGEEEKNLFVSSTVMRDACDIVWHEEAPEPPNSLFTELDFGTTVHVNAKHVEVFVNAVLPHLTAPIVLVSGCDTVTTRVSGYENLLESENILHWFLQNFELDRNLTGRVTKLPLGLNFHKLEPGGSNTSIDMGLPSRPGNQQLTLRAIRDTIPPLTERPPRVYANFHLNMDTFLRSDETKKRQRARKEALQALRERPWMLFEPWQTPRNMVWNRYREVTFEASPHGNGLDCHRTWEALLLKTIPIVKTSPLDSMYDGLPVVIIDDWREIDQSKLDAWQSQYENAFDGPIAETFYSRYWIERFRSFAGREP